MEIDDKQLAELKTIELELLKQFVSVCDKLKLKYFLVYGTLLGAVRHKGFIPWDDDIDVAMPRKDYEIFVTSAQAYLPKEYFVQTFKTDPEYPVNFAKIRNSNTTFIESSLANCKINHGIYIDVFPLDYYPQKNQKVFEIKKLLLSLRISYAFKNNDNMKLRTRVLRFVSRLLYPSLKYAVVKTESMYSGVSNSDKMICHGGAYGKKEIFPSDWIGDGVELEFEGLRVNVYSEYEKYLTQIYGDYMQLPHEEKRVAHHYADVIDLTKSYAYYL